MSELRVSVNLEALKEMTAERDRLREALEEIAYYDRGHPAAGQIARRALGYDPRPENERG